MRTCDVYWLGQVPYGEALALQRGCAAARCAGSVGDCLLLVEHPPVITLGRGAKRDHLVEDDAGLRARGVEVWEVERGGDVTFHGPGQLVGYPILDLAGVGRDLHRYVRNLEEVLIRALGVHGIDAERHPGQTGVWATGAKIASIGVHVSRWVSRHGFALNVDPDLEAFDLIVPCGLGGIRMTSMGDQLGRRLPVEDVVQEVAAQFALVFGYTLQWGDAVNAVPSSA